MVQNTRTPARADQLRPLNVPRPIEVISENDLPIALIGVGSQRQPIVAVQETWHIDDEWWRDPIHRRYHRVQLANGSLRTIYRDGGSERWQEQRY
jgi:hypothetical protein